VQPRGHAASWVSRAVSGLVLTSVFWGLLPQRADATLFTLTDQNSLARFDTATTSNHFDWLVDGVDKISRQSFWYRVGNAGADQSLHLLPIAAQGTSDTNFDGNPDTLFVRYTGAGFRAEATFVLRGGVTGSGASDMGEQINITNTSASPLDFHFFQYNDFDLTPQAAAADTVLFSNANAVQQSGGGNNLTETVVTPIPSHHAASVFPVLLNELTDGNPTTLNDSPAVGVPAGPGDMVWAYEWDVTIAPNDTFQISKDKNLSAIPIPEPTTLSMLGTGVLLLARRRTKS
jgi:hypothetical protein